MEQIILGPGNVKAQQTEEVPQFAKHTSRIVVMQILMQKNNVIFETEQTVMDVMRIVSGKSQVVA